MQMSTEELMDTATFKRFNAAIESVLDCAEDVDIASMIAGEDKHKILVS